MEKLIDIVTKLPSQTDAMIHINPIGPVIALVVVLILELAWCFFGYKAMKVFATIAGFAVGAEIGTVISEMLSLKGTAAVIIPLLAGFGCALVGFILYKFGVFIAVLGTGIYVAQEILSKDVKNDFDQSTIMIISVVIGLALAILTMIFFRVMLIISSALTGGMGFATVLLDNIVRIRWDSSSEVIARCVIGLALALFGIIYQFHSSGKG
jgi:hypothetical protein